MSTVFRDCRGETNNGLWCQTLCTSCYMENTNSISMISQSNNQYCFLLRGHSSNSESLLMYFFSLFSFPATLIICDFDCFVSSQSHTWDLSQTGGITLSLLISMATTVIIQYWHIKENKETHQQCPVPTSLEWQKEKSTNLWWVKMFDGLDGAQVEIKAAAVDMVCVIYG